MQIRTGFSRVGGDSASYVVRRLTNEIEGEVVNKLAVLMAVTVTAGIIAGTAACAPGTSTTSDDLKELNDRTESQEVETPVAPTKSSIFKINAGDWEVGTKEDIAKGVITPGTYVVFTPESGILCTWSRVKSFDGEFDSIITNGIVEPGVSVNVVVKKTDEGLSLQGDCFANKKR